ncbi:hypothetical protein [Vagococcus fluvialis]
MTQSEHKVGLSSFTLKIIAIIFMVIDHVKENFYICLHGHPF